MTFPKPGVPRVSKDGHKNPSVIYYLDMRAENNVYIQLLFKNAMSYNANVEH